MGNEVLKTAEERGFDKGLDMGIDKGLDMGLKSLVDTLKDMELSFQNAYEKIISNEAYKNVSEADVKKYYYK